MNKHYGGIEPEIEKVQRCSELADFHFTVSCLVAWPLNESEAGGDLVLIETSLLFSW